MGPRARALLVLVAGADPGDPHGGAQASFVRAHGLAAVRTGWDPVIVCLGATDDERDEPYGRVVRVATGVRSVRQLAIRRLEGPLGRTLLELAEASSEPVLAHGFDVWGTAAVSAVEVLRHQGRTAAAAISSRTLYRQEHEAAARDARGEPLSVQARYRSEQAWSVAAVDRRERWAYRRADQVWANHRSVVQLIHERHGPEIDVRLVPSASEVDLDGAQAPPPAPPANDPWRGTAAGRLRVVSTVEHRASSGLDVLIQAVTQLGEGPLPLSVAAVLLGGGPLLAAHQRLADGVRADSLATISVPGPVPDVRPHLLGADLVVVPSLAAPTGPGAVLDAQRLGRTVVATSVDGVPEEVVSGESGILVPPGDAGALAAALATLAADPALRTRLGRAGQARFQQRHGADAFTAGLSSAYSDLLTHALETAG